MQNQPKVPITVAYGDGIGPEIMKSALAILDAADARIEKHEIEIGEKLYLKGVNTGITPEAFEKIRATKVFLKAPITTPRGGGYKSLNVTIRTTLGLFANVRPCSSYAPFVETRHPNMDVVIVRENEEDLYTGIEHRQTYDVSQCLKIISRPGSEKIIRYAFQYARANNRKKVSCFIKDNIMKITDGSFAEIFTKIAKEYPDIITDQWIIDIGAARLADTPTMFDVIVTPNLYGDIISDIAAQVTGSVGLAGSSNIGTHGAMFEAIHGSAPTIANLGVANPTGLILASVMMLQHIGQPDVAGRIHNAWLKTIEDRYCTADINPHLSDFNAKRVGTEEFTKAVIARLGKLPQTLKPIEYTSAVQAIPEPSPRPPFTKDLVGVDVFLHWDKGTADSLGKSIEKLSNDKLKLSVITNRSAKVYPGGFPETFCTDHWRCRFVPTQGGNITHKDIIDLLANISNAGFDFIKTENLCKFDGKIGYSLVSE